MNRISTTIASALALSFAAAGAAGAQGVPSGPSSVPGSGDSAKISNGNRENNAEYNRLVGASDAKAQAANGDKVKTRPVAVPATAADIKAGAALRDVKGVPVGTIDSVTDQQVVVQTGQTKIGVPLVAFGKDDKGLLLSITAQQFNDAVAKAHAQSHAAPQAQP
ncbi:MAG: hypothetical protein ABI770_05440 [Sphingomicrobium sp.]